MSPYVLEPEGSGASLASMGIATAVWFGVSDLLLWASVCT